MHYVLQSFPFKRQPFLCICQAAPKTHLGQCDFVMEIVHVQIHIFYKVGTVKKSNESVMPA